MKNYKFGIVTSFYNVSKYVDSVIESIKNQTYDNWIYFVTDDGSSDDTKEKVLHHCDNKKIFYVEQKFKKEMFWQPQRFISSDCDFVITMDSDDYVLPKALQVYNHLLNFYKNENIVFISTDSKWFGDENFDILLNPTYVYCDKKYSLIDKDKERNTELFIEKKSPNSFGSFRGFKNIQNLDFGIDKFYSSGNNDILHSCLLQNFGSSLIVKRDLYNYYYRSNSISHKILSDEEWSDSLKIEKIAEKNNFSETCRVVNTEFNDLYTDLNSFLLCNINQTAENNLRINLITKNINKDFSHIKNLYFDHFIDINNFVDDFDYYIVNTSDFELDSLSELRKICKYIYRKKYKQINFYNFDARDSESIKENPFKLTDVLKKLIEEFFGTYFWNAYYRHFSILVTNSNYDDANIIPDIVNESGSLGDALAWIPIVNEFAIKHRTKVNLYTPYKELFDLQYPLINFFNYSQKNQIKNKNPIYLGCFEEKKWKNYSLQEIACNILNIKYKEIKPLLNYNAEEKPNKKYVCIATQSTAQCKYWNNPNGWNQVVEYLNNLGYDVVCIDKHKYYGIDGYMNSMPDKCIDKTGEFPLQERINDIMNCEFFIGLGSGLSWLAWACNKPVIMISGFSDPKSEFYTEYRVHNKNVCNSCWNDSSLSFDRSNWLWCPRNKNFECSKEISFEMVKEKIDNCISKL